MNNTVVNIKRSRFENLGTALIVLKILGYVPNVTWVWITFPIWGVLIVEIIAIILMKDEDNDS